MLALNKNLCLLALAASVTSSDAFVTPSTTRTTISTTIRPTVALHDAADSVDAMTDLLDAAKDAFGDTAAAADSVVDVMNSVQAGLLDGVPVEALYAVAGVLAVGIITVSVGGGGDRDEASSHTSETVVAKKQKAPSTPKIDVSIPYDAAARLAYDAWLVAQGAQDTEATYVNFKAAYYDMAIAQVTAKQKARELVNFDPNKTVVVVETPPKPPASAPPKVAAATAKVDINKVPFFAEYQI